MAPPHPAMDPRLARIIGAFAVFFTLALPLFAAAAAVAVYAPIANLLSRAGAPCAGPLADLFFNNFKVALSAPLLLGVAGAAAAFVAWRKRDADERVTLARLLVIQTLAAFGALLWLAAFLVAVAKG